MRKRRRLEVAKGGNAHLGSLLGLGELGLEVGPDADLAVHHAGVLELPEEVLQLQVRGDYRALVLLLLVLVVRQAVAVRVGFNSLLWISIIFKITYRNCPLRYIERARFYDPRCRFNESSVVLVKNLMRKSEIYTQNI